MAFRKYGASASLKKSVGQVTKIIMMKVTSVEKKFLLSKKRYKLQIFFKMPSSYSFIVNYKASIVLMF